MECSAIDPLNESCRGSRPESQQRWRRLACGAALAAAPLAAWCQTGGFFDSLGNLARSVTGSPAASAPEAAAASNGPAGTGGAAAAAPPSASASGAMARLQPSQKALLEMRPDVQCLQVEERFDILQKVADYAGTDAQLRLQTLLASDFQQSQLTDSDKDMLKYLAYTTVWIPSSVETKIGRAWAAFSSKGSDAPVRSQRTQRAALERESARLEEIRKTIGGFPGDARLVLEPDLHDGALSRVGGLVVVSPRFLALMDEKDGMRDVLFAHELSHLYKRHALKDLQYQLISSATGWNIAKRLLRGEMPGASSGSSFSITSIVGNVESAIGTANTVRELVAFIRENQTHYSSDQEYEADACALRWLTAMNVDPRTAWIDFSTVLQDPGPSADTSYASLHPSPADRDKNIAKAFDNGLPSGAGLPASGAAAAASDATKSSGSRKK